MSDDAVAIVGMACRFPGAVDLDAYWDLLRSGRSGLRRFTEAELDARQVPASLRRRPDYVPVGGLIDDQDHFDPVAFGYTDAEAALLDPQLRLFLQISRNALEHAGHARPDRCGTVGVFAGSAHSAYLAHNLADRWDPTGGLRDPLGSLQTSIATQTDYLPLHAAYRLDLKGPAVAVQSSCSTSLVAVHLAVQSLLSGECDTALAGGVSLIVPQGQGYLYVPDGIFSRDGTVRAFGADSSGIVYSQGVGAVVLRRLEDARTAGDPILAVIVGSAVNNDGGSDKAGFTAPSIAGQASAIAEAHAVAGIEPSQIGLLEAHGTGTPLGDPVEIAALERVFGAGPPWCALGSVKSNIGHANTAAGIASLIKAVLAQAHGVLPPTLHAERENPLLKLDESPFELVSTARAWDAPPLAGVSSFGIGGTNCHVVLEPAPARAIEQRPPSPQPIYRLSGASAQGVVATAERLARWQTQTEPDPIDLAHSLALGRPIERFRAAVDTLTDAVRPVDTALPARLVTIFPGAGAAFAGMGSRLYALEPVFRRRLDETADLLSKHMARDVRSVLSDDFDALLDVAVTLPATYAVSLAVHAVLKERGYAEHVMVGHSLGECTAAVAAGLLDPGDAAALVAHRCRIAAELAGGGAMLAVAAAPQAIEAMLKGLPKVQLAVVNGPEACVLSGDREELEKLASRLQREGIAAVALPVGAAMHSSLMDPGVATLRDLLGDMRPGQARCPVVSTRTGALVTSEFSDAAYWAQQLRAPVRFAEAMHTAATFATEGERGRIVLTQIGPGTGLLGHARAAAQRADGADEVQTIATLNPKGDGDDPKGNGDLDKALAALWSVGVDLPPPAVGGRMINVPGYAFDTRRLWIDPPEAGSTATSVDAAEPLQVPLWQERLWPSGALELPAGWRGEDSTRRIALLDVGDDDDIAEAIEWFATTEELGDEVTAVIVVTRRGVMTPGDARVSPAAAVAAPMLRVLGQERPGMRWAVVDLDGQKIAPKTLAQRAIAWAAHRLDGAVAGGRPESGLHLAVRGPRLLEQRLTSWTPEPAPGATGRRRVAVVTGGLGGVGQLIVRVLAGRGHRVVVTTRSADRAADLADLGDRVSVVVCDATDTEATCRLFAELAAEGVDLVVHAAGAVAGAELAPVRRITPAMVSSQLAPKADAAKTLASAIEAMPAAARPAAVLALSSVTVHVGGVGMGPYAAANAAMDAVIAGHSACDGAGPRWHSVQSDGWNVGTADREEIGVLTGALDRRSGEAALRRIFDLADSARLPPVVALATTDLQERSTRASFTEPTTDDTEHFKGTRAVVAQIWADLLGRAVPSSDADFFALGGHSLLAARMLTLLGERTGRHLGLRNLLDDPTLAGLARRVDDAAGCAPTLPANAATAKALPPPDRYLDADGAFPMTRVQHAYWVGRGGGYRFGGTSCYFYLEYQSTDLDPSRLERAWNRVIDRHLMLRVVTNADGRFVEVPDLPAYRIRVHDFRTSEDPQRRLERLRKRVRDASPPSDRWPLVQWQIARIADDCWHVLIGVDVLICDAASWWRIEADLYEAYQAPDQPLPPITTHPGAITAALAARRDGPEGQAARRYWDARRPLPPGPDVPLRRQDGPAVFRRRQITVPAERYRRLQQLAAEHGLTPTAILLAVYTETLQAWGPEHFSVVLTLFDRPAVEGDVGGDVNELVGDFTTLLLHEAATEGTFLERAKSTQKRLFADLDHRAWGALDVLADTAGEGGAAEGAAVVFTSALGLAEQAGEDRLEWLGKQVAAASRTPQTLVDHQVLEHHGELRLQWDTLDSQVDPAAVDDLVARHKRRLDELVDCPDSWKPDSPKRAVAGGALPSYPSIVLPLRHAASASAPTLHLVHPSGGDVICYADLAQRLDGDVGVVSVSDPQLCEDAGPYPRTVEEMASAYLDALRQSGARGPWLLGGWSMGGTVAQEMCRQLVVAGEPVQLLVMLDSCVPDRITAVTGEGSLEGRVAVRQLHALEAYLGVDLQAGPEDVRQLVGLSTDRLYGEVAARLRRHRLLGSGESAQVRVEVLARHLDALARHRAASAAGGDFETLLVRCTRRAPRNSGIGMGVDDASELPDLGWSHHLPDRLCVVEVDTHHYGVLHPPALATVSAALNTALSQRLLRERKTARLEAAHLSTSPTTGGPQ